MIVAFEGAPGSGKTSAIAVMTQELGCPHVPEMLVTRDIERHFSDDDYDAHDLKKHMLARDIDDGVLCLMDRSRLSYDAYVCARGSGDVRDYLRDMPPQDVTVVPDHYIYLRVSPVTSIMRRGLHSDNWKKDDIVFATRVVDFYDEYFASLPRGQVTIIDAEPVHEYVLGVVRTSLDSLLSTDGGVDPTAMFA